MARGPSEPLDFLGGLKKLSKTELEFMEFIWQHPEGIASEAIYGHFPQSRGTKSTILYNISEKGYVQNVQQGRHHIYTAVVSESEYEQALIHQQLNKYFGESSFERLIAAFCGKKKLTEKQTEKVRDLLKELENDMED
jgi:predicted transcriptional regulator